MPLEEGVFEMLVGGFVIIISIIMISILVLWYINKKHAAYGWVVAHLAFFSVAVHFLLKAIGYDESTMASENISWNMGVAGIIWAVSMFCLLFGIKKLSDY